MFNGNRMVDAVDESLVNSSLGKSPGQSGYNANAELDMKKKVTAADLAIVTKNMGHALSTRSTLSLNTATATTTTASLSFGTLAKGAAVRPIDLVIHNAGKTAMRLKNLAIPTYFKAQLLDGVWGQMTLDDILLAPGKSTTIRLYVSTTKAMKLKSPLVFYDFADGTTVYRKVVVTLNAVIK